MKKVCCLKVAEMCFEHMNHVELGNPEYWESRMYEHLFYWAGYEE